MAIYINGEEDGEFNDSDYIEFYAIKNDGAQDSEVYRPKIARTNKYLSLFSEESAVFLTVSKFKIGKRIKFGNKINLLPDSVYLVSKIKIFEEDWNHDISTGGIPNLLQSYFEPNESLTSKTIHYFGSTNSYNENISLRNYINNFGLFPKIEVMVCSRLNFEKSITLKANDNIIKRKLNNFNSSILNLDIINLENDILPLNIFIDSTSSTNFINGQKADIFSLLYYNITYPSKGVFVKNIEYLILPNKLGNSVLKLKNVVPGIFGFNVSDIYNQVKLQVSYNINFSELDVSIEKTFSGSSIWLSDSYLTPKLQKIEFSSEDFSKFDYFIVTDSSLLAGANNYKDYRESLLGGGFKVNVFLINKLYDEYCYGEKNPIAIHRFSDFILQNTKVKNLLLLGKALSLPSLSKTHPKENLVPSFGYPASDVLLTAGLNGKNIDVPGIPTGRVSARNNQEVLDYLDKVKDFEANRINNTWNKNFLQLGGGKGEYQVTEFKSFLKSLGNIAKKSKLGVNFQMLNKSKINDGVENIDISKQINNGIGMLTFFGHSSSTALDLNIGYCSDDNANFKNSPKYPFMFFNGCGAGNVFDVYNSLSKDWLLTPQKGAIAILAHSFLSFSNSNMDYMKKLYNTWFSTTENLNLSLGQLVQKVAESQINENPGDLYTIANVHQMVLQGDPAIRIFNMTKPDFQTVDEQLFLTSTQKNKAVADGDSVKMGIVVSNYGIYEAGTKVNLNIQKTFADGKKLDQTLNINAVAYQDTVFVPIKKDLNLTSITVTVDNDSKIDEMDEANNTGKINFNWAALKNMDYYSTAKVLDILNPNLTLKLEGKSPVAGMEVTLNPLLEIVLKDDNDLLSKSDKLTVNYRKICKGCPEALQSLALGTLSGSTNEILASIKLNEFSVGEYEMFVQGFDANKNASGAVFSFTFNIIDNVEGTTLKVYPNPMSVYTTFEIGVSGLNGIDINNYSLSIYDQKGVVIKTMTGNLSQGINNAYWDRKDNSGNTTSPGVYIYKMQVNKNGKVESKGGKISLVN